MMRATSSANRSTSGGPDDPRGHTCGLAALARRKARAGMAAYLVGFALPLLTGVVAPRPAAAAAVGQPPGEVLARVAGTAITSEEIDSRIRAELDRLRELLAAARERELDLQINSRLLEAEARRRGLSASELLRAEVVAVAGEPGEADARGHFDAHRERFQGPYAEHREAILAELRYRRQQERAARVAEALRASADVTVFAEPAAGADPASRQRVLATVNGQPITAADVEDALLALAAKVEEEVRLRRWEALQLRINDLLLEAEAGRRRTSVEALLAEEIAARARPVTESDARAVFEQSSGRSAGDWNDEDDRLRVLERLHQREAQRAQAALAEELRAKVSVEMWLRAPAGEPR